MGCELWRHKTRAWLFHFVGQDDRAFAEYATAFQLAPTASASCHLGFIACTKSRFAEGATWFAKASALDPTNADTLFNLGFAHEQGGQAADSIAPFAAAVKLNPALDRAWYGLAMANARLGKHAEAASALEETVRLQPMHGEAWYHLGMACHLCGQLDRLKEVIVRLRGFEPKRANQLIKDCARPEVAHLHTELPF